MDDHKSGDPHDEVVRLEERIEDLAEKIESCRKFILASRIAVAGGVLAFSGMLFRRDPFRSRHYGCRRRGVARWHRRMGVEPQHGKASGE